MSVTARMTYERRVEKQQVVSSAGVERRAKRETALVSYNDLDATLRWLNRLLSARAPMTDRQTDMFVYLES